MRKQPRSFTAIRFVLPLLLLTALPGCLGGFIFTYTVEPVVINMDNTPLGTKQVELDLYQVKEPFSGFNIQAQWNSNAIGDAALANGLTKVYFADLRTLSILGGIFKDTTILVSGD